jgi:hypothetical protein
LANRIAGGFEFSSRKWTPDGAASSTCTGRAQPAWSSAEDCLKADGEVPYAWRNARVNASCVS